jgi:hypothetical protein
MRGGSGWLGPAIKTFKHLIDRTAELIQSLPNIIGK